MSVVGGKRKDDEGRAFVLHDGGDEGHFDTSDTGGAGEKLGGQAIDVLAENFLVGADAFDLIAHHVVDVQPLKRVGRLFHILEGDDQHVGQMIGRVGDDGVGLIDIPFFGELDGESGGGVGVGVGERNWRQQQNGQRDDEHWPDHRSNSTAYASFNNGRGSNFWPRIFASSAFSQLCRTVAYKRRKSVEKGTSPR